MSRLTNFIITFSSFAFPLLADSWLEEASRNINEDAINWVQNLIHDSSKSETSSKVPAHMSKQKCKILSPLKEEQSTEIYIFLSFSVPQGTWLSLSEELKTVNGIMVLNGIPKNSFKEFYNKVHDLNEKGFTASLEINPKLFEKYSINHVPSFVYLKKQNWSKLSGNISLKYALDLFKKEVEEDVQQSS